MLKFLLFKSHEYIAQRDRQEKQQLDGAFGSENFLNRFFLNAAQCSLGNTIFAWYAHGVCLSWQMCLDYLLSLVPPLGNCWLIGVG